MKMWHRENKISGRRNDTADYKYTLEEWAEMGKNKTRTIEMNGRRGSRRTKNAWREREHEDAKKNYGLRI